MRRYLVSCVFFLVAACSTAVLWAQSQEPVYRMGSDVTPPKIISKVDPSYTDEARAARVQGTVTLECVIRKDGSVEVRRIVRGLGYGLDDQAMTALQQWKFEPGKKAGEPVAVMINVEVN